MRARRAVACAVACALTAACNKAAPADDPEDEKKPVPVTCTPAALAAASDQIDLRGVVGAPPDRDAVIAPSVAGRLTDVHVHEGDRVKAGDLIAAVDDPTLGPAVREAEAATGAAKAAVVNADAALARVQRLFDQGIAPRRDVDDALARHASAAADLAAAAARGDLARRQQGRARVTAPIAGVVVHVLRRTGELVDGTPATPVVEIADPSRLELRADVPAAQLVHIREGTAVHVTLDALPGTSLVGTIVFVSPAVDTTTGLGVVRASIAPPPADADVQLKLGLAGTIGLSIAHRAGVVQVPAVAVRRSIEGGEEVVVCARGKDPKQPDAMTAEVRAIKVGARSGDQVELADGVKAGELIVTAHVVGLEDGAELAVGGTHDDQPGRDDKPPEGKAP